MVSSREYWAPGAKKRPLLIGLTGIVAESEVTRLDTLFTRISTLHGIHGVRLNYSFVVDEGARIRADFDIETGLRDLQEALEKYTTQQNVDSNRLGIIASSVGSIFLPYYLAFQAQHTNAPALRACATISPVPGWNALIAGSANAPHIGEHGLTIPGPQTGQATRIRYIPRQAVSRLMGIDGLRALKEARYEPRGIHTMTIIGRDDVIVKQPPQRQLHEALGGGPENLLCIESGHDLPPIKYEGKLINFLLESLK